MTALKNKVAAVAELVASWFLVPVMHENDIIIERESEWRKEEEGRMKALLSPFSKI